MNRTRISNQESRPIVLAIKFTLFYFLWTALCPSEETWGGISMWGAWGGISAFALLGSTAPYFLFLSLGEELERKGVCVWSVWFSVVCMILSGCPDGQYLRIFICIIHFGSPMVVVHVFAWTVQYFCSGICRIASQFIPYPDTFIDVFVGTNSVL